jgi:phosphoribosylformylglycinamidine synthase
VRSGDRVVVIGGRTGRDGIHGATFSSGAMSGTHTAEFAHAVQIGNAITEKKVLDVLLQARDAPGGPLYRSVTDCGAGGLSSAVGELGRDLGAEVQLERVPLKYDGLRYDEIWISEAQERMVLAVPPDNVPALTDLCRREDVEATDIGRFTDDGRLLLRHGGCTVGDLDMEFLHEGRPRRQRQASWEPPRRESPPQRVPAPAAPAAPRTPDEWRAELLRQLTLPDIASKEWIIRQYDHEVQAGSVIKPLMGPGGGPTDGAVIRPVLGSDRGVALSCGLCPGLSDIDPYVMAVAAIDEAVRNNLCVGGDIGRMALLDNFCWGGVSQPQELGGLVRAAQGCHDAALVYGLPFISGKDSLNNVFDMSADEARRRGWPAQLAIPGTLLISAISVVADVRCCRSSNLKQPGNRLLWLRPMGAARRGRRGRTGGAGQDGWSLATLGAAAAAASRLFNEVAGIRAVHDISEGGLLVAAAEMAIGSRAGLRLDGPLDDGELLRRGLGSYLVEASPGQVPGAVEFAEDALQILDIGEVLEVPRMELIRPGQAPVVWSCDELRSAWRSTFSNG